MRSAQQPFRGQALCWACVLAASLSWICHGAERAGSLTGRVGAPGIPGATVVIAEAKSGFPLKTNSALCVLDVTNFSGMLFTHSDSQGAFCFSNLPAGTYRVFAQSWSTNASSDTLQLHGTAENIVVPSTNAQEVLLRPLGSGSLRLQQPFPNEFHVAVSTQPLAGDPILGLAACSPPFMTHILAFSPPEAQGRLLTISGLPEHEVHLVLFVNDDSPGFGAADFPTLPRTVATNIAIVAGWSDACHEPPARIRHIQDVLEAYKLKAEKYIPPSRGVNQRSQNLREKLKQQNSRLEAMPSTILLPNGEQATRQDVYAAWLYDRLRELDLKRLRRP